MKKPEWKSEWHGPAKRIPQGGVGIELLEFSLYDAVTHFNMGAKTVLLVYEAL